MVSGDTSNNLGWRAAFFALGDQPMPPTVDLPDRSVRHVETFKHDFFAATGLYRDRRDREVVVKIYRSRGFIGLPLRWAGRWMAGRESRHYQALAGVAGVPEFEGQPDDCSLSHQFVPGRPLHRSDKVDDHFFDRLAATLEEMHRRNITCVDLDKPENILLGDDGRPYLIDFQISWYVRPGILTGGWISRRIFRRFKKEDLYHFRKHKRRIRPDQLTEQEAALAYRKSCWIVLHRIVTRPYFIIRRWVMDKFALPRTR